MYSAYPYLKPSNERDGLTAEDSPWVAAGRIYTLLTGRCKRHMDGGLPGPECIRLLRCSYSSEDGYITIQNKVFPIASAPKYRALSYTWGHATGKSSGASTIFRDPELANWTAPVNLVYALERLGRLQTDEWNWYWIDFLCIQQDNNRERSEQVSNMHRIYQQAEGVDVWLGRAPESYAVKVDEILRDVAAFAATPAGLHRMSSGEELLSKSEWNVLASFFSRRWFHRLWTLQEFSLARNPRVMLGDHFIDPDVLSQAATYLFQRGLPMQLDYGHNHSAGFAVVQQSTLRRCIEDVNELLYLLPPFGGDSLETDEYTQRMECQHYEGLSTRYRDMRSIPDYEAVMAWVFWRSAATFATEPRDYVYGILGIVDTLMEALHRAVGCDGTADHRDPNSPCPLPYQAIKPDYSLSTAQVFQDFIIRLMHGSVGIRAMTLIQGGHQGDLRAGQELQRRTAPTWIDVKGEMPSWVPNLAHRDRPPFSSTRSETLMITATARSSRVPSIPAAHNIFGSSSHSFTQRFHIRDNHLHVFGRRIGVVGKRSSPMPYAAEFSPCNEFALNLLRVLATIPPKHCTAETKPLRALLHTLGLGLPPLVSSGGENSVNLKPWHIENYLAWCISSAVCLKMHDNVYEHRPANSPRNVDAAIDMLNLLLGYVSEIHGLSGDFLQEEMAMWIAPEKMFDRSDIVQCLVNVASVAKIRTTCGMLITQFPQARGQSVLSVMLDSNFVESLCGGDYSRRNLLGLGPEVTKVDDEIWAIQGSEWPFILRPLRGEDEETVTTSGLGEQSRGTADDGRANSVAVYQLVGEAYIHGVMNGELEDELVEDLQEIVIR